jgi:hypothetical protein
MSFALSLWDLGLWLAASSFLLLITSEVASPYYGRTNMLINLKRMRKIAFALGIAFLFVISLKIMAMIQL